MLKFTLLFLSASFLIILLSSSLQGHRTMKDIEPAHQSQQEQKTSSLFGFYLN